MKPPEFLRYKAIKKVFFITESLCNNFANPIMVK